MNDVDLATRLGALRVGPAPLAPGAEIGPLAGIKIVVKDLIDVVGQETGAGNPQFLADRSVALADAPAVARLRAAGASVIGKSHTDELAFSLSGTNIHYGTPVNPRDPSRVPGGSSSGSASAVAGGLVPLALATDTGGSIRVPASYCGIFGLRPTHGRVPLTGVIEFAPFFGTVGLLAADGQVLARGGAALLDSPGPQPAPAGLVLAEDLLELADPAVAAAIREATGRIARRLGLSVNQADLSKGRIESWFASFRGRQLVEAWQSHGDWIRRRHPEFGPGIAARFAAAEQTPPEAAADAAADRELIRAELDQLLPQDSVLALPSAATVAPPITLDAASKDDLRLRTMQLTCVAGLGGLPALSLPIAEVDGLPVGVCLVGRPGDDERLLAVAAAITQEDLR